MREWKGKIVRRRDEDSWTVKYKSELCRNIVANVGTWDHDGLATSMRDVRKMNDWKDVCEHKVTTALHLHDFRLICYRLQISTSQPNDLITREVQKKLRPLSAHLVHSSNYTSQLNMNHIPTHLNTTGGCLTYISMKLRQHAAVYHVSTGPSLSIYMFEVVAEMPGRIRAGWLSRLLKCSSK